MTSTNTTSDVLRPRNWTAWLDRPLPGWWCALGWVAATALFVGLTRLLGGPTGGDAGQSLFSTWAFAHGVGSCAYPPSSYSGITPLYPLLSGGLGTLAQIGHGVPFPSHTALGPHCMAAISAMSLWSPRSGALVPTLRLGFLGWFALMAGLIALLRTTHRGRRGWEPATLMVMACAPPILLPLAEFFHPEDLLAMGLSLGGLACARRGWWVWTGVLVGLAITSQQFALLVAAPLFVLAPRNRRMRFLAAAAIAAALVVVPLIPITSGRVIKAVAGAAATPTTGKTLLAAMHLPGPWVFVVSRIVPIALAMAITWLAVRYLGPIAFEPVPLVSLIATSLAFRLVFEVNLLSYYFMAVTVSLVLLDMLRGRLRLPLVAWIAVVTLAFNPFPWGYDPFGLALPMWLWQLLLVPPALALAVSPLIATVRDRSRPAISTLRDAPSLVSVAGTRG
jgi:hypothetical protein